MLKTDLNFWGLFFWAGLRSGSQDVGAEQMGKPGSLGFPAQDYFAQWLSQVPETK